MAARTLTVARSVWVSKYKAPPKPLKSKIGSMIMKCLSLVGFRLHLEDGKKNLDEDEGWGRVREDVEEHGERWIKVEEEEEDRGRRL